MSVLVETTAHDNQVPANATLTTGLPTGLAKDFRLLSERQRELMVNLCSSEGDRINHLFEGWMKSDVEGLTPASRRRLISQLEKIDEAYPTGLIGYLNNARYLLGQKGDSVANVDYLKGWKAVAPQGEMFELGTDDYKDVEKLGKRELGNVGFVLAAGRSGGIGCTTPIELATETTHLQLYIETILAMERRYGNGTKLPLCIVVSDETQASIENLLEQRDYFGMPKEQITVINQGMGMPTLCNSDKELILSSKDEFNILTSTHGHGDVHGLLNNHKVAKNWKANGIEWIVFLEDANGLALHNLALMLGVSVKHSLVMNMLTYPREAKEPVESMVKLVNEETNETRTVSVDYDQLNSLLAGSDKMNESTGFSQFPATTNQFVVNLDRYLTNLERTNGIMPEFVVRTEHDTLAHLECRMQDVSTILSGRDALKVGHTCVARDDCYSPVDNKDDSTIVVGEAKQYGAQCKMMRLIGCEIEDSEPQNFKNGVTASIAPQVVIKPDAACLPSEYKTLFPYPEKIKLTSRSSLVVSGSGVVIESLNLDGALVVEGSEGVEEQVIRNKVVKNGGWVVVADEESVVERVAKRGYRLEKNDTETVTFTETLMDVIDSVTRFTTCG